MKERTEDLRMQGVVRFTTGTTLLSTALMARYRGAPGAVPQCLLLGALCSSVFAGAQYATIRMSGNRHTLFADLAAGTVMMGLFRNFISKPPLSPVTAIVSGVVVGFGTFQTESLIRNRTIQEFVKGYDENDLIALRDEISERYTNFVDDIVFSLPFVSLDPSLRDVSRSLRNGSLKIEDLGQDSQSQSSEEGERNTL